MRTQAWLPPPRIGGFLALLGSGSSEGMRSNASRRRILTVPSVPGKAGSLLYRWGVGSEG